MSEPVHIISLGAGVQSSTMALMASKGELGPMPVCAIFADTKREPGSVYDWLDYLENKLAFPLYRVSKGNLAEASCKVHVSKKTGLGYTNANIPVFIKNPDGSQGVQSRACTSDFKIKPIHSKIWNMRKEYPSPKPHIFQWVGISRDEAHRIKNSRKKYITNHYPLIDKGITRKDCLQWMAKNGYPTPPRSACDFCPYHSNEEWQRLKTEEPEAFSRAVDFEKEYQNSLAQIPRINGIPFLHRLMKPLGDIDFEALKVKPEPDLFGNECEGMCGV